MAIYTTLEASRGYGGGKAWVARIIGTDRKFGLNREFLAGKSESSRSGATGSFTSTISQPGLYQVRDTGQRKNQDRYYLITEFEGETAKLGCKESTAYEIAARLEAGESVDQICSVYRDEEGALRLYRNSDGKLAVCPQDPEVGRDLFRTTINGFEVSGLVNCGFLEIKITGYGKMAAMPGQGSPVILDFQESDHPRVTVWGDITSEEPTYHASLAGAKDEA